jgi:Cu-Zn family superoxide dismutase
MKTTLKFTRTGFSSLIALTSLCVITGLTGGCKPPTDATSDSGTGTAGSGTNTMMEAVANLNPTQGNEARGTVTFTQTETGVRVVAHLTGLKEGEHGFHVHEKGDCSAPDASSAGGHFNPTTMPHGAPGTEKHHVGDLGNIKADASGTAHLDQVFPFLQLSGANSIVGRAVIVHAGKDDLTSQPSGEAGGRVACGIVEKK